MRKRQDFSKECEKSIRMSIGRHLSEREPQCGGSGTAPGSLSECEEDVRGLRIPLIARTFCGDRNPSCIECEREEFVIKVGESNTHIVRETKGLTPVYDTVRKIGLQCAHESVPNRRKSNGLQ